MKFVLAAFAVAMVAAPAAAQDGHAGHAHGGHAHNAAAPAPAPAPATTASARLNLDTPVEAIVADPAGKAVLEANLPGVTSHESYAMFKTMGLRQLAGFAPEQLTPEVLAKVEAGLAAIK